MKRYILSMSLFLSGIAHSAASYNERALIKFYAHADPKVQPAYLSEIVRDTEKYARVVNLSGQIPTMLSMGHRESGFYMYADDKDLVGLKKHSVGIYQTRADYRTWLRHYWELRGYQLGPDDSVDTQCAFGVAEFRTHINRAGGNIWGGVRRYNGIGKPAREYARKVMVSRRIIFGKPYYDGESIPVYDGLKHSSKQANGHNKK